MRISSSIEYATRLMVTLACERREVPVPAERLSESENIPCDYVNQILLRLKRAGLVESRRGAGGGYELSRAPSEITLGQVVRAVEGQIFEEVCGKYDSGSRDCHHQGICSISPVWQQLGAIIEDYFDGITLAKILEERPGFCGRMEAIVEKISTGKGVHFSSLPTT
jgi:Rrf2 family protein